MVVLWKNKQEIPNLNGFTLILPSVSVGNVGQLTTDLLISTLSTKKVGIVHHVAILPLVGADPYNPRSNEVTTAADLHIDSQHNLAIIQIRSPLIKDEQMSFLTSLTEWMKTVGIKDVVMLSSCHAYMRWDQQMTGSQFRYLASNVSEEQLQALKDVGHGQLEERENEFGQKFPFLSGSGFLQTFLDICDLPVVCLIKFVDEGDNTQDAISLLGYFNRWKKVMEETKNVKIPFSWRNLFGGPAPIHLY